MALEDLLEMINKNKLGENAKYTGERGDKAEDEEEYIVTAEVDTIEEAANTRTVVTWEDLAWL